MKRVNDKVKCHSRAEVSALPRGLLWVLTRSEVCCPHNADANARRRMWRCQRRPQRCCASRRQ